MPLTDYVQSRIDAIKGFLADPDAVVLELRCPAEQRAVVGKLLVGIANEGEWVWAAHDEQFVDVVTNAKSLGDAIASALDDAAKEFAAAEIDIVVPAPFDVAVVPRGRTLEQALVEYGEEAALAVEPYMHGIVVACSIGDDRSKLIEHAAALGRIAEACEGGRLKFLLLVDEPRPLVRDIEATRPRIVALRGDASRDVSRTLANAVFDPLPRVVSYDAPRRGQTWLPSALVEAGVGGRALVVRVDDVRFWRPIHFYGRAAELVIEACRARGLDVPPPAAPLGRHGAEIDFARRMAALQRDVLGETELVVVLCPQLGADVPDGELAAFAHSVRALARAAFSSRVTYCAVAPGLDRIAPRGPVRTITTMIFRIDGPVIEKGLTEKLAKPDLPTIERLRCMSALAAYRMHNGDPESGIELSVGSLQLAQSTEDPIEIASAWYGLGSALYHCAALDKAVDAYAQCVDLGVTHDNAVLAAQGMTGMGHCYFVLGQTEQAITHYNVAVKYYSNLRNPLAEAYVRTWVAEALAKDGKSGEAVAEFDRALACCDKAHETFADAAETSRGDIRARKARLYGNVGLRGDQKREAELARKHGATAPPSVEP